MGRRARRPELADYLHETAARDDTDDSVEMVAEIRRALAGLRPDYQSVFVLFHEQGRSYEEIAAIHGRPVGTIKTWLHRTRLEVLTHLRRRGMVPAEEPAEPPATGT
jgi:RNA polymerase sigma-70 factor (ECF subfamily)